MKRKDPAKPGLTVMGRSLPRRGWSLVRLFPATMLEVMAFMERALMSGLTEMAKSSIGSPSLACDDLAIVHVGSDRYRLRHNIRVEAAFNALLVFFSCLRCLASSLGAGSNYVLSCPLAFGWCCERSSKACSSRL